MGERVLFGKSLEAQSQFYGLKDMVMLIGQCMFSLHLRVTLKVSYAVNYMLVACFIT